MAIGSHSRDYKGMTDLSGFLGFFSTQFEMSLPPKPRSKDFSDLPIVFAQIASQIELTVDLFFKLVDPYYDIVDGKTTPL